MGNKNQIIKFILHAFSLYILWFIFYDYFIEPNGKLNSWLNSLLAHSGSFVLSLIGYNSDVVIIGNQILLRINATNLLGVGNSCNGLELFVLFAGFIVCFPGNAKNKIWFVPVGIISIHVLNSIRAAALALNQYYYPQSLSFNHHYTFTIIVYAFIFYLWILWANKVARKNKLPTDESVKDHSQ